MQRPSLRIAVVAASLLLPVSAQIGNEVVFDSLDALNAALASDVRHRLREDYKSFPVKPGPNTHYAMQRVDFRP